MTGTVISVCRGRTRDALHEGRAVRTAIFKTPAEGPVRVTTLGLEGDVQADGRYHGGTEKAMLAYSLTHTAWWETVLGRPLEPGQFGQNLTISRFVEEEVRVGDVFRCGTAVVAVTTPRSPCFKIGIRIDRPGIVDEYLASGRWGIYLRVVEEGVVAAGDPWTPLESDPAAPTIGSIIAEKMRRRQA